jgi:hypothetical protein
MQTPGIVVLRTSPVLPLKLHPCSGAHAGEHGAMCSAEPGAALDAADEVKQPFVFGKLISRDVALNKKR